MICLYFMKMVKDYAGGSASNGGALPAISVEHNRFKYAMNIFPNLRQVFFCLRICLNSLLHKTLRGEGEITVLW